MGWVSILTCFTIGILLFVLADEIFVKLPNSFILKFFLCFIGITIFLAPASILSIKKSEKLEEDVEKLKTGVEKLKTGVEEVTTDVEKFTNYFETKDKITNSIIQKLVELHDPQAKHEITNLRIKELVELKDPQAKRI